MKALTIMQPWAWAIAAGHKRVENRNWPTYYRGPLAIHAGRSRSWINAEQPLLWPSTYGVLFPPNDAMILGAIIATAELVDCVRIDRLPAELQTHAFVEGPWCWVLGQVKAIEPIYCSGSQQLWTTDLI